MANSLKTIFGVAAMGIGSLGLAGSAVLAYFGLEEPSGCLDICIFDPQILLIPAFIGAALSGALAWTGVRAIKNVGRQEASDKAFKAFIDAEVKNGKADPAEGTIRNIEP